MKGLVVALIVVGAIVAGAHWAVDAHMRNQARFNVVFSSSDGGFGDATDTAKGRSFRTVLWNFEHYKLATRQPDVTLIRIAGPERVRPEMTELAVPIGVRPPGRRSVSLSVPGPELRAEIDRRAAAAMAYWETRVKTAKP